MIYGSVCSGIEAATVAWKGLGWTPAWFSEIEPFPCRVLKHHYPHVPNLGDMLSLHENETFKNESINILVGGPLANRSASQDCGGGLSDERGNLALEFCRILIAKRPQWFIWENVPGALSSYSDASGQSDKESSDFAAILTAFRECGYSCAYRVLDAQYFGVPQRRRRIFVVGYFGDDWRPPATVLFERKSMFGNIKKSGKTRKGIAGTLDARTKGGGFPGSDNKGHENKLIPCWWDGGQISQTLDRVLSKGQTMPEKNRFPAVLAYPYNQITGKINKSNPKVGDPSPSLTKRDYAPLLVPNVRRLTPLECERLQGFPDHYTAIPGAADTPRYQSIGNSMAVPVMRWIGNRIDVVDTYLKG